MSVLSVELTIDPLGRGYAAMSDGEVLVSIYTDNITVPYSRFISLRACADQLTDVEYATFKGFLTTVSGYGDRYSDMVTMLSQPCSDAGDTGGLDFGCDAVRTLIDTFGAVEGMVDAAAKLKALAEHQISRAAQLSITPRLRDIITARS